MQKTINNLVLALKLQNKKVKDRILNKPIKVGRFDMDKKGDAAKLLVHLAKEHVKNETKKKVLIVGQNNKYLKRILRLFKSNKIDTEVVGLDGLNGLSRKSCELLGCVTGGFLDSNNLTKLGLELVRHPFLSKIPFEYVLIPHLEYSILKKYDWQDNTSFVSPLLVSDIDYFEIYEKSLTLFEKKCQVRDFMDLCQLLDYVIRNDIIGDVAEFGSYKGHSGYLISRLLDAYKSKKKLYMFDTFDEFPSEDIGIDYLWNKTHLLDFKAVKDKFKNLKHTYLIKGDFTKTFTDLKIKKLSFVYIDCDSYRGTKFILDTIFDKILAKKGVAIMEDYGHAPLLGSRVAFHEYFDSKRGIFKFFSQFSGFQVVIKI